MSDDLDKSFEHQYRERQKMQSGEFFRQSLVISGESPKSCRPAETTLNYPPTRQQHKAFFRFRQFDHFRFDAVGFGFFFGSFARIVLVNVGNLDRLARHVLHGFSQIANLLAVLFVSRCHQQRQQIAQSVNRNMRFVASPPLGSVVSGTLSRFGRRLLRLRESKIAADGSGLRPEATRNSARRS